MMRLLLIVSLVAALAGCGETANRGQQAGSPSKRLKIVDSPAGPTRGSTYIPVYSSIYLGLRQESTDLSATVSVRNVSAKKAIVLHSVEYYGSDGVKVRDYLEGLSELGPLAAVEFVIQRQDTRGGHGASFLVKWSGPEGVDEPLMEAVMVGQAGSAGISFTSAGRRVASE